jgi:hypothetical protein
MINKWIYKKLAAHRLAKAIKRDAMFESLKRTLEEWRTTYFKNIVFPIVILEEKDFTAVSSLEEYVYDIDIHRVIDAGAEMIDSLGNRYKLMNLEKGQWVPIEKTGAIHFEELRLRLTPMLYMPKHKKEIGSTKNIQEMLTLLYPY